MPLAPKPPASASRLPLLALALASFGIGTTEFVIMGLLPNVAGDLGVSIPKAGLLVSGYALGVTFGTALGQALGWRATFWAVVAIGVAAAIALYAWLPRDIASPRASLMQEARS